MFCTGCEFQTKRASVTCRSVWTGCTSDDCYVQFRSTCLLFSTEYCPRRIWSIFFTPSALSNYVHCKLPKLITQRSLLYIVSDWPPLVLATWSERVFCLRLQFSFTVWKLVCFDFHFHVVLCNCYWHCQLTFCFQSCPCITEKAILALYDHSNQQSTILEHCSCR